MFFLAAALAAAPPALPTDPRSKGAWIQDDAGVIAAAAEARMHARISALHTSRGPEIVIVTINTLPKAGGFASAAELASAMVRTWKVGRPEIGDGLVMLLDVADRKLELKTGAGLKVPLPDAALRSLKTARLDPFVLRRDWPDAIETAVDWAVARLEAELPALAVSPDDTLAAGAAAKKRGLTLALGSVAGLVAAGFGGLRLLGWLQRPACPSCGRRTVERTAQILLPATTEGDGTEIIHERCASCRWTRQTTEIIPRLPYIDESVDQDPAIAPLAASSSVNAVTHPPVADVDSTAERAESVAEDFDPPTEPGGDEGPR